MKISVIGGTGFVGKAVMKELEGRHAVSLSPSNDFDLLNFEPAKSKIKKINPDLIINLAAHVGSLHYVTEFSADVIHDNSMMALNLYKIIRDTNPQIKVINLVANCSYPGDRVRYIEDEYWNGAVHESVWAYGNARRLLMAVSKSYNTQYGIKTVNLFVPNAYGPGDSSDPNKTHAMNGIIIRLLKAEKKKETVFNVWGSGTPVREWVFVEDLARIINLVIDKIDSINEAVNIGQGEGFSINEIVSEAISQLKLDISIEHDLSYSDGAPQKIMDQKRFRKYFPEFKFTPLQEGISKTIGYYIDKI